MTALSFQLEGCKGLVIAANPIYVLDDKPSASTIIFEVLAEDATRLRELLATPQFFHLDGKVFGASSNGSTRLVQSILQQRFSADLPSEVRSDD